MVSAYYYLHNPSTAESMSKLKYSDYQVTNLCIKVARKQGATHSVCHIGNPLVPTYRWVKHVPAALKFTMTPINPCLCVMFLLF